MALEITALTVAAIISVLLPLVVLGIILKKNKEQWKSILGLFLCGGLIYVAMQWGIKEHGLTWLFNNTNFSGFMINHYIPYLLVVAFVGALLTTLAQLFVVILFKRKLSFGKVIALSVGYSMLEAGFLVGVKSINTIVQLVKGTDMELGTTTLELFLSGYERILLFIIEMAITVVFVYFIKMKKAFGGGLIAVFCYTMAAFLPGFFLAFTLPDYYEVFDRSIALTMVYIILTAAALASLVMIKVFKHQMED